MTEKQKPQPRKTQEPQGSTPERTSNKVVEALEDLEVSMDKLYKALGSSNIPDPEKPGLSEGERTLQYILKRMRDEDCVIHAHLRVFGGDQQILEIDNILQLPGLFHEDSIAEAPSRLSRQFKDQVSFPLTSEVLRHMNKLHNNVKPLSEAGVDDIFQKALPMESSDQGPLTVLDVD